MLILRSSLKDNLFEVARAKRKQMVFFEKNWSTLYISNTVKQTYYLNLANALK